MLKTTAPSSTGEGAGKYFALWRGFFEGASRERARNAEKRGLDNFFARK